MWIIIQVLFTRYVECTELSTKELKVSSPVLPVLLKSYMGNSVSTMFLIVSYRFSTWILGNKKAPKGAFRIVI